MSFYEIISIFLQTDRA